MAAAVKVSIATTVVCDGKLLQSKGKMYDESTTVQVVVDTALEKAADHVQRSLNLISVEAYQTVDCWHQAPTCA